MEPVSPFQSALSDFTYEAASGGAVRHWTDLGYTVKQIMEKLDFPTPFPWVQKQVWERLTQTGAILLEEPGSPRQTQDFVWECDQYGRRSFRRIIKPVEGERPICWKEVSVGSLLSLHPFLREEIKENGVDASYVACPFGLWEKEGFQKRLDVLDERKREYLSGLPWPQKTVYHRLDLRMLEVVQRLLEARLWQGDCYFLKSRKKLLLHDLW